MEMIQATSCSNTEVNPCSARSKRAALANGRTASATGRMTRSILNRRFFMLMPARWKNESSRRGGRVRVREIIRYYNTMSLVCRANVLPRDHEVVEVNDVGWIFGPTIGDVRFERQGI